MISPRRVRRIKRVAGPIAGSIVIHACILSVMALLAIAFARPQAAGLGTGEVVLSLDNPMPTRQAQDQPSSTSDTQSPQPLDLPAPGASLADLTSTIEPSNRNTSSIQSLFESSSPSNNSVGLDAIQGLQLDAVPVSGVTFAGVGARSAKHIVYVVDASGAMLTSLPFVLDEVRRSVNSLSSSQSFAVILFRQRTGTASDVFLSFNPTNRSRTVLVRATMRNKKLLDEWLNTVTPGGKSNPSDGLAEALRLRPDVVFLLSRSIERSGGDNVQWGKGKDAILAELDRTNPRTAMGTRRAVIKTIQFLDEDPTGVLQAIGAAHGGQWMLDGTTPVTNADRNGYVLLTLDQLRNRK
ncbi:MAG: hypothetical protein H6815_06540 [Phycisphaeraceae bacterium]|nr:hypothetical protein [Phycisphaerales bacterium]MCB9860096.1 hypothetical protein [Phycisphaeraceae bacterium]